MELDKTSKERDKHISRSTFAMPVEINKQVWLALELIRKESDTNMLDHQCVADRCDALGHHEAAEWIRSNERAYALGVFKGFRCSRSNRRTMKGEI